jgi:hypothetical protein
MKATALALDMLKGERQRYVSVKQVAFLASLHSRETGETFRHPDYTILQFDGAGDGWELFRMANGAGILKLIALADVQASGAKRRKEDALEAKAGEMNELADRLTAAGVHWPTDAEYLRLRAEYRELLAS